MCLPILLAACQSGARNALLRVGNSMPRIPCSTTLSHDTGHELARGLLRSWLFVASRRCMALSVRCYRMRRLQNPAATEPGEAMSEMLVASFSF